VVLPGRLRAFLAKRYPDLPAAALDEATRRFSRPEGVDTLRRNLAFHELLRRGIDDLRVERPAAPGGEPARVEHRHVYAVDWEVPDNNELLVVNQLAIKGQNDRRPDLVVYLNGLPVVVFELKNPWEPEATVEGAWNQVQHYRNDVPQLFETTAFAVVSDQVNTLHGVWTAGFEHYAPWKSIDGEHVEATTTGSMKTLVEGLFRPERLLAYLRDFLVFEVVADRVTKKGAKYHQFFAVQRAVERTLAAYRTPTEPRRRRAAPGGRPSGAVDAAEPRRHRRRGAPQPVRLRRRLRRLLADALPHALRLGFTGTPISFAGADTVEVFGDYIHTYDIRQSELDGTTKPIFYEPRQVKLHLGATDLDAALAQVATNADAGEVERTKAEWTALAKAAGAVDRVGTLARDLLEHFHNRSEKLVGKAMVVCMTRENCVRLYDALTDLPGCPEVKVVMTGDLTADPAAWSKAGHITTKTTREAIKERMKDVDALSRAFLLVRHLDDCRPYADEVAFFQMVRKQLLEQLVRRELGRAARQNLVKAKSFQALLEETLRKYHNRLIDAAAVIRELIAIRRGMEAEGKRAADLGLSDEEVAFYDAIVENAAGIYEHAFLRELVHDVVKAIRANLKVDWTEAHREDVRAGVQSAVKRTLVARGIKPQDFGRIVPFVMRQAEALYRDWPLVA
jgi:type I site-specific restriction-modification system R (restriction) subunit